MVQIDRFPKIDVACRTASPVRSLIFLQRPGSARPPRLTLHAEVPSQGPVKQFLFLQRPRSTDLQRSTSQVAQHPHSDPWGIPPMVRIDRPWKIDAARRRASPVSVLEKERGGGGREHLELTSDHRDAGLRDFNACWLCVAHWKYTWNLLKICSFDRGDTLGYLQRGDSFFNSSVCVLFARGN